MTEAPVPEHIRTIKYKITANIHRVKIAKRGKFFSKVQWKRHQNEASTRLVQHQHQLSIFEQELQLEYSFHYDTQSNNYLEKRCDMIVIIDISGDGTSIKNGGYARFDLSEAINQSQQRIDKKIGLIKNPDPNAYIEFSLLYEPLEEVYPSQMSIMNSSQLSLEGTQLSNSDLKSTSELKTSSKTEIGSVQDQPISTRHFKDSILQDVIFKFESLSTLLKNKTQKAKIKNNYFEASESTNQPQKIQMLQKQLIELRITKQEVEFKLQEAEDQKRDLQRLLDKKSKQIVTKDQQIVQLNNRLEQYHNSYQNGYTSQPLTQAQEITKEQYQTLQKRFRDQQFQLFELREKIVTYEEKNKDKKSVLQNFYGSNKDLGSTISKLQKDQLQLQKQLAVKSNQIGEMFNAAFEIGGAPLLDKLQNAIGLVELR